MTSPDVVLQMIREHAQGAPSARTGIITDINTNTVTVAFSDGTGTSDLAWLASAYTPVVGHLVLVVPTTSTWVVTGQVTAGPAWVPDEEVTISPVNNWSKYVPWNWGDGNWFQVDLAEYGYSTIYQGFIPQQAGGVGHTSQNLNLMTHVLHWGDITEHIPSGSTIQSVSLRLRRAPWEIGPALSTPVMWPHTYTTANPPNPAFPPSWSGPGDWPIYRILPAMARGQDVLYTLPAEWVTHLISGELGGVGFHPSLGMDDPGPTPQLGWGARSWQADGPGNGDVIIRYTPPPEDP